MANFQPDVTFTNIMTALRSFLLQTLSAYPTTEVVQGQVNRTPPPASDNYVVMWPLRNVRLATSVDSWKGIAPVSLTITKSTRMDIQIDVHGPASNDIAQVISTLWRSLYGVDNIPNFTFAPLYASEPRQIPFINGENQYEMRWVIEASLQITPNVSTPMQFADKLSATILPPVDGE